MMTPQERHLFELLFEVRTAAKTVLSGLKDTPGGDAVEYKGSMNSVEWLREAVDAIDGHMIMNDIKRPDDEGEPDDDE